MNRILSLWVINFLLCRWTIIAQQLPGRTDNEVKNFWNKKLKKKLTAIGIDPITHRPFSQILADYGNIGAFPKARNQLPWWTLRCLFVDKSYNFWFVEYEVFSI
jgi:hypothetical protein